MVEFSLVQLNDDDKDSWNEFVTANPYAQAYHLWEWGEVLSKTYKYQRYCLVVKCGNNIVGVLPLFLVRGSFFPDKLISSPFCEYGGPLIKGDLDPPASERILTMFFGRVNGLARKLKVDYIELRNPPLFHSSLASFGFTTLQRYVTFKIDLTKGRSELWRNLDKKVRNSTKKAMKAGVKVRDVDANHIVQYYDLYLNTEKRLGSPPHSYDFFLNIYNLLKQRGWLRMTLATYDGIPIAGIMAFCFNGKICWWNNATNMKYRSLNPTNLLLWHVIEWGIENDLKVLDLGRTRLEDKGIYFFKSRWGGSEIVLRNCLFFVKNTEIPDPIQTKYLYLSKMWSLLPSTLSSRIGPKIISGIGL